MTVPIRSSLLKGAAWLTGARVVVNTLGFLSTIILARLLVPADFGLVAIATAVLAVLGAMVTISPSAALLRMPELTDDHFNTAWTFTVGRGALVSLALCAAAWPVGAIYGDDRLIPILLFIALTTFVDGFANPKLIIFKRNLIFWQQFVLTSAAKFLSLIAAASIAYFTGSYWALVIGSGVASMSTVIISYMLLPYAPRPSLAYSRAIWDFASWISFGQIVNTLNWRLDHFLIGGVLGNAPLGQYTVGNDLASMPTAEVVKPLQEMLYPAFSKFQDRLADLRRVYLHAQQVIFAITMPVGIGFALTAEPVVYLVLGEKWAGAIPVIQTLSVIFAIQSLVSSSSAIAMTLGQTKTLFKRDLAMFGIRVPIILVGLFTGGFLGIIYARAVSGLIGMMVTLGMISNMLGLSVFRQVRSLWRTIIASLALAVFGIVFNQRVDWAAELPSVDILRLAVLIFGGATIYLLSHAILWWLAGRPDGPEAEAFSMLKTMRARLVRT